MGRSLSALVLGTLFLGLACGRGTAGPGGATAQGSSPATATAQAPIASSNFVGFEDPLNENGAWVALTSMSPDGVQFPKNNGAFARLQPSGPSVDSGYLYWASLANGANNYLYRIVATGSSCSAGAARCYSAAKLVPHSPVVDGDRIRLIARGPVIYGLHNGVREFIYNTGTDPNQQGAPRYDTGTTGMLAFVQAPPLTDATIASWSTGPAPASSGTWAST